MINNEIKILRFDYYRELLSFSEKNNIKIIGNPVEGNRFEAISFSGDNFLFGIVYYDYGIKIKFHFINNDKYLLIGFENKILVFDIKFKKIILEKQFDSPFYEFIFLKKEMLVVVIFELGVCAIDYDGKLKWVRSVSDIITDFKIVGKNAICVECADETQFLFLISNGNYLE